MGTMFVVHWIMQRWIWWQKKFAAWAVVLLRRVEGAIRGLEREDRNASMGDSHHGGARDDLESIGIRTMRGRRNSRRVLWEAIV
jgi:hypothetical protein